MNAKVYDIDFDKVITWLVPARLRKSRIAAYLQVIIRGVVYLYQDLLRFRKAKLYQLMITPQVCYLERLLNDRWDFTQRRIRIVDGVDKPPVFIYQEEELKPVFIYQEEEDKPVFLYTDGESEALTDDFIIQVPVAVSFNMDEMKSLVKAYKLAGTKFNIQIIY